jgi:hypothetical protein
MRRRPEPFEAFDRSRLKDKEIAEMLGWRDFAMKVLEPPMGVIGNGTYKLMGIPPFATEGKWVRVEVPKYHSDMEEALKLGAMFGLTARRRRLGYMVRHISVYGADPYIDACSSECYYDGPGEICRRVIEQVRSAMQRLQPPTS